jgi:hypothetical protein
MYQLDQSGPTRFTDLSWEVKLLNNGSETTILSGSADADLIANGGNQSGSGASFDYGGVLIPVEYTFTGYMGQPYDPRDGHYYLSGHGSGSDNKTVILSVTGHVIDTTVPASIEEILSLFDISVSNNTLAGEGPGDSADGRLKALRNMLTKVDELLAAGDTEEAYKQLLDAYKKIDGDSHIPDFVSGEATTELAQMILDLKTSLEQSTSLAFSTPATSQNPVPATVWLLGSGLLGLAGWRRFRKINERFNQITISNELKKGR